MSGAEVGVVIPTWNSAKTLAAALLSLQQQHGCGVQVVVADSGSTDGTLDICSRAQIRCVYVPPGNMYRAINEGMRLLDTEWVAYMNSDDFAYTDAYARLVSVGDSAEVDVAYGNSDFVDAHGRFLYSLRAARPRTLHRLFQALFFGFMPHAAVFRKSLFDLLGGFDERFRHIADMEFFARACFGGRRFALLAHPSVAVFRIHPGQISTRERVVARQEIAQLQGRWGTRYNVSGRLAIASWKARNAGQYLIRWLRTGSIRRP